MARTRHGNVILTIIIVVFALLVLGIASCAIALMKAKAKVEAACEAYLANVQAQRYDAAYDSLTPAWHAAQDRARFVAMEEQVRQSMGALVSKSETGFFESTLNAATSATIGYSARWQHGAGTISFSLVDSDGAWAVQGVRYDSPQITWSLAVKPQ